MVPLKEILDDGSYKLIERMLNTDPKVRPDASQVRKDEIFADDNQQSINQLAGTAMGNSQVIQKVIDRNVEARIFRFDFRYLQFYL
jgi:serine/threonine protein kinase